MWFGTQPSILLIVYWCVSLTAVRLGSFLFFPVFFFLHADVFPTLPYSLYEDLCTRCSPQCSVLFALINAGRLSVFWPGTRTSARAAGQCSWMEARDCCFQLLREGTTALLTGEGGAEDAHEHRNCMEHGNLSQSCISPSLPPRIGARASNAARFHFPQVVYLHTSQLGFPECSAFTHHLTTLKNITG